MDTDLISILSQKQIFVNMVVSAWQTQNKRVNDLLEKLTEEQFSKETAAGRNTGIYLIGHLAAVNDNMLPILGFGDKLHPELDEVFLKNGDKSGLEKPSLADLKKYWKEINDKLTRLIDDMQPDEWFTKHDQVSAEDFAKEPHRNKLNILINRSIHQGYHLGQLAYL